MVDAVRMGTGGAGLGEVVTVGHFEDLKASIAKMLEPLNLDAEWERMKAAARDIVKEAEKDAAGIIAAAKAEAESAATQILAEAKAKAEKDAADLIAQAKASVATPTPGAPTGG